MRLLAAILLFVLTLPVVAQDRRTRNVVLITLDGLRWQELFSGIDPLLMSAKAAHMEEAGALRERLWRSTTEERREALMPFFWGSFAPKGAVYGNVARGSSVKVTNGYMVSYPGYSEILTGRAQDDVIQGNAKVRNPTPSVLQFLRGRLKLPREKVAIFGSWELFDWIGESEPGSIVINSGYKAFTEPGATARAKELSGMQFRILSPWDSVRHDFFTFELAMDYLKSRRPRLLHIAFGETDDWAHDRRYDRVLQSIEYFDRCLRELWTWIERTPGYKGATSVVITVDHGRGSTLEDWSSHGRKVQGAEQIWIALAGPDTPARGEVSGGPEFYQRDVAPTILDLLGVPHTEYTGVQGKPIR
ncbi:MAG: alkaline phosphatase family protein [Bryobacteraceae bacterium]